MSRTIPQQDLSPAAFPSLLTIEPDLTPPFVTASSAAPGKRVRQSLPGYECTAVHHALYLPTDWQPGRKYPVIVEYAGNQWRSSAGTVEGCSLGCGATGGRGAIWLCLPFVDAQSGCNALHWWGDIDATKDYCIGAVEETCGTYGGDADSVILCGFSRGSIACNFIGLHDDGIASLWRAFICHSHYDGVRPWPYAGCDRASAAERLARLEGRPQFVSHEMSVGPIREYLAEACPDGAFTFVDLPYRNHTDQWVLRDIPERAMLRNWLADVLERKTT